MRNYPRYTGFDPSGAALNEGQEQQQHQKREATEPSLRSGSHPFQQKPGRKRVRAPEATSGYPLPIPKRSLFQEVAEGFKELERLRTKPLPYPIGHDGLLGTVTWMRPLKPGDTIMSTQLASAYPDYKSIYRWSHEHSAWVPNGFMLKRARR